MVAISKKRIFINIIASYGRSIISMLCGVFTGRWTLMVLGNSDYGLYVIIGGLTTFITFFNSIVASAVARFYAFSVGESQNMPTGEGLENCRSWFNTALTLHTVIPLILMLIGYPIGEWAIRKWLTIPQARMDDALIIFRITCFVCFINMVSIPYQAMYVAKQYIAELTVYGCVATFCNVLLVGYMVLYPRDWLILYAGGVGLISVIPQILIVLRARMIFPECRIVISYLGNLKQIGKIGQFVGWQIFGHMGTLARSQGIAILVNKMFGVEYNTTSGLAGTVAAHTGTLASALNGAFTPVLSTQAGSGDQEGMLRMAYRSCKYGLLLTLLFALPLALEIDPIIKMWLKVPPPYINIICLLTLGILVIDSSMLGGGLAVTANGNIAKYYVLLGTYNILVVPIAWFVVASKLGGFAAIFVTAFLLRPIAVVASAFLAKSIIGFSPLTWFKKCISPCIVICAGATLFGISPRLFLGPSLIRTGISIVCTTGAFGVISWFFLENNERQIIVNKLRHIWNGSV